MTTRLSERRFRLTATAAMLVLVTLTGCIRGLSREFPDRVYYALEVDRGDGERPAEGAPPVRNARGDLATLAIRPFRSPPGLDGRQLVYSPAASRFEADFYNGFFLPVADLIRGETSRWLRECGLFAGVVEPGSLVDADYVLEGAVRYFYGDYRRASEYAAVISIQTFLLSNDDTGAVLVRQADYDARVPLESKRPAELVRGFSAGVTDILARLEADLAEWAVARDEATGGTPSGDRP